LAFGVDITRISSSWVVSGWFLPLIVELFAVVFVIAAFLESCRLFV
jgi:hypothetical protein